MKGKKRKMGKFREGYNSMMEHIRRDKKAFVVFCVMRALVLGVLVRSIMLGQWESCMISILALLLLFIPPFVEKKFKIDLPTAMEIVVYVFVFCAEILGEIECYYVKFSIWDDMLHTVNGFMFAAFGFCLIDILNRNNRFRFQLSAGYLAIVAFCFSMTIGVLWEFAEYSVDHTIRFDMQKDTIVKEFSSVTLDGTNSNIAIKVNNIERTVIQLEGGEEVVIEGGYLDIGLVDTTKDLFVNFIGAVVFSLIGYIYVKQRGKGLIASSFIPQPDEEEDEYTGPEEMS
ncbi:MAG: hypothetical protein IJZ25_01755 [Lachnospiraceae bacterium]|nr:hypothetical protein [Lachnospiraceae bacterium]